MDPVAAGYRCHGSGGSGNGGVASAPAPFVVKTYKMVSDPRSDEVIAWGMAGNTFVVVDPFAFAARMLPSHFKHNNFSSFVRQLNTYGFRKVDPDKWEFAHKSFLRGQTHLLHRIVRKESTSTTVAGAGGKATSGRSQAATRRSTAILDEEDLDEEARAAMAVAAEVARLKQEQRATEAEMGRMWERLRETERKPKQMLAFLLKVAAKPQQLVTLLNNNQNRSSSSSMSEESTDMGAVKVEHIEDDCEDDEGGLLHDSQQWFFGMPTATGGSSIVGRKRALALTPPTFHEDDPEAVMDGIIADQNLADAAAQLMPHPFMTLTTDPFAGSTAGMYQNGDEPSPTSTTPSIPYASPDMDAMEEELTYLAHPYPQGIFG